VSRIGALLSPFAVYRFPPIVVGMLFFMSASLAGHLTSFLPETKGRNMGETDGGSDPAQVLEGKVIEVRRMKEKGDSTTNAHTFFRSCSSPPAYPITALANRTSPLISLH
jgi:hypothetical protein